MTRKYGMGTPLHVLAAHHEEAKRSTASGQDEQSTLARLGERNSTLFITPNCSLASRTLPSTPSGTTFVSSDHLAEFPPCLRGLFKINPLQLGSGVYINCSASRLVVPVI